MQNRNTDKVKVRVDTPAIDRAPVLGLVLLLVVVLLIQGISGM